MLTSDLSIPWSVRRNLPQELVHPYAERLHFWRDPFIVWDFHRLTVNNTDHHFPFCSMKSESLFDRF